MIILLLILQIHSGSFYWEITKPTEKCIIDSVNVLIGNKTLKYVDTLRANYFFDGEIINEKTGTQKIYYRSSIIFNNCGHYDIFGISYITSFGTGQQLITPTEFQEHSVYPRLNIIQKMFVRFRELFGMETDEMIFCR